MSVKEEKINDKNIDKYSTDNTNTTNFNERINRDYNNTLTQQQDAINKTLDNTLNNIKRTTDEADYTERFHDIHNVLLNIKNKLFKL